MESQELLTEQEIFDKVTIHLRTQKRAARNKNSNSCFYRMADGRSCAIGCLIEDSEYTPGMETKGVTGLYSGGFLPKRLGENFVFLKSLQEAHDNHMPRYIESPSDGWERAMKKIAEHFNLEYKEP